MITLPGHLARFQVLPRHQRLPGGTLVDLHSHSLHSDGTLAPCEVARRMGRAGVGLCAMTDHDTMAGVAEFQREAALHGMRSLAGVELTCACAQLLPLREAGARTREAARPADAQSRGDAREAPSAIPVEVHVLVYGIPPGNPSFENFLDGIRAMRRDRVAGMAARLAELGCPLDLGPLERRLESGSVGRPHLARQLVAAGHVTTINEAFQRWLADGRPAWLPKRLPEVKVALDLVHELGGAALVAHPGKVLPEDAAHVLIDLGVDGLEARHPAHRSALVRELHELCRRNHLSASAGSDFHDPLQGRYRAPDWRLEQVGGRLQALLESLA